jgi:hypothetical protein
MAGDPLAAPSASQKLGHLVGGDWLDHVHEPVYAIENRGSGPARLLAGNPKGDSQILSDLAGCMAGPYLMLYVLHTPRGEGQPGRYQSPELSQGELNGFLSDFSTFLAGDARYDLWVHSPSTGGTIVWDRHNLLYGYGPLESFVERLTKLGFIPGTPGIPSPHTHYYRQELDSEAKRFLAALQWTYSPLHPEDEQFVD